MVPYIPSRCAILLFPAPNSDVVAISLTIVLEITDIFSTVLKVLVADNLAFLALLKKYLTFFCGLCLKEFPQQLILP